MLKLHTAWRTTAVLENTAVERNVKTDAEVEPSGVEAVLRHGCVSPIVGAPVATATAVCFL